MYAEGQGIPKDLKTAYAWLNLASTSSNAEIRDSSLKLRDEIAKNMTPEDVNSARGISRMFYDKYANP
jgi:TPR repeat protein